MASTYSPLLGIELIGIGDQNNAWGTTNNTNLGTLIEQAIAGTTTLDVTAGNVTLTTFDGTSNQARQAAIKVVGTPGVARNIIAPALSHVYVVSNGSDSVVTIKTTTSTGIAVPVDNTYLVYFDPTIGVLDFKLVGRASATANTANTLALRDASGNFAAGIITATFAGPLSGNVTGNLNGNLTAATPTAATQIVTDNSTAVATTAFVRSIVPTGVIMMWYGSVGTIPSGWRICDGTMGTPDLRDRFVVGAGATYAVGVAGGSANAVVVNHDHTYSGTTVAAGSHNHEAGLSTGGGGSSPYLKVNTQSPEQNRVSTSTVGNHQHGFSGTTNNASGGQSGTNANLPPYYALCFIMKA